MHRLWSYSGAEGAPAAPPSSWPAVGGAERTQDTWELVFLAHPRCPCTRAGVGELNRLLAAAPELRAQVWFVVPGDAPDDWTQGSLWSQARTIAGVRVFADVDGRVARAFGAQTSGQVLLFDPSGALAFSGGLTPARGHAGDSAGRDAILGHIRGDPRAVATSPVFGCSLSSAP